MPAGRRACGGFTLLLLVAALAVAGLALSKTGPRWTEAELRVREDELLRVGQLYAGALEAYSASSPAAVKTLPLALEQLVLDERFVGGHRHLRQLYPDPLDPQRPWGLLRDAEGRIYGVYSLDQRRPFRTAPVRLGALRLDAATRYSDWKFIARGSP